MKEEGGWDWKQDKGSKAGGFEKKKNVAVRKNKWIGEKTGEMRRSVN